MIEQTLSHFRIVAKLGEGGMGAVYLAEDTSLKREVALKVLPEHLSSDPDRLARFQREAESLAALNHPNIVGDLLDRRRRGAPLPDHGAGRRAEPGRAHSPSGLAVEEFFDLAVPIADAMAAAHAQGIVHRDIKPANVMVTEDGAAKVSTWGWPSSSRRPRRSTGRRRPAPPVRRPSA